MKLGDEGNQTPKETPSQGPFDRSSDISPITPDGLLQIPGGKGGKRKGGFGSGLSLITPGFSGMEQNLALFKQVSNRERSPSGAQ